MTPTATHYPTTPIVDRSYTPDLTVVLANADRFETAENARADFRPHNASESRSAPNPPKDRATPMGAVPCGSDRRPRRASSVRNAAYAILSGFRRSIDRAMPAAFGGKSRKGLAE